MAGKATARLAGARSVRTLLARKLVTVVECKAACKVVAELRADARTAKRLGLRSGAVIATARASAAKAGAVRLALRPTATALRKLKGAKTAGGTLVVKVGGATLRIPLKLAR